MEIILTVAEGGTRQEKEVVITVKDSGRGIKDADKDSMFELNVRGDGLIETGNGLGLYCARKAAELQGGDVILENSSPNQGSVFKIKLPFATARRGHSGDGRGPPTTYPSYFALGICDRRAGSIGDSVVLTIKTASKVAIVTYHDIYDDRYVTALGRG